VLIYPNPNHGQFHCRFTGENRVYGDLKIYDNRGVIVYENTQLTENQALDINLAPGYYMADFPTDDKVYKRVPFMVQ
jgi:hypothetical protein